jgi:hypothetical protein
MKTWRIEFSESDLAEIYYACQYKLTSTALVNDKRWKAQLKKIMDKILSSGATI